MLNTDLIHPQLLAALGRSGHGSKILLTDGNYPHSTGAPASAERIFLNVAPGLLEVDQVLGPLIASVPIEAAEIMVAPDGVEADAIAGYRAILPGIPFVVHDRQAFYSASREPDVSILVATGDQRVYANLLLTIGVRTP
jgi:L-fucose mutarotase